MNMKKSTVALTSHPSAPGFRVVSYKAGATEIVLHPSAQAMPNAGISIVIGPNGSGKSRILASIVDEFSHLSDLRSHRKVPRGGSAKGQLGSTKCRVDYRLGDDYCSVERNGSAVSVTVNGIRTPFENAPFPNRAFAVAHLPVDRYRFSKSEDGEFYVYMGLRQATNLTTTGALEVKVTLSLFRSLEEQVFKRVASWLALMGISPVATVELEVAADGLLEAKTFDAFFKAATDIAMKRRRSLPSVKDFQQEFAGELGLSWRLFERLRAVSILPGKGKLTVGIELTATLLDIDHSAEFWERSIEAARSLRLFKELRLYFNKDNRRTRFSDFSSGEQQILGTMTRLFAALVPNSLVVIDEPEVSLHPYWQKQYVATLIETLADFPSTHVLIATHSHFLVGDLHSDSSSLLIASAGTSPTFTPFEGDVYGRSPENILYRAFGVGTAGNFYIERDLATALQMVSGVTKTVESELEEILTRLRKVSRPDNPAMTTIIAEVERHLESN